MRTVRCLLEAVDSAFVGFQNLGQAVFVVGKEQFTLFDIIACGDSQILHLIAEGAQNQQLFTLGFPCVAVEGTA